MRLAVLFLLVLLTVSLTLASEVNEKSEEPHLRVRRGFGCPANAPCFFHCRFVLGNGRRGGYCGGRFKQTCYCVMK
uniref:Putative tick defensins 1 n=1 Tax=Amblyomma aureolatum TaxID=187763 RepID=A0A1E1X0B1_9ACAR